MGHETLTLQRENNVGVVRLPGSVDCFEEMVRLSSELAELFSEIAWHEDIWLVVVTGAEGKDFLTKRDFSKHFSKVQEEGEINLGSISKPVAEFDRPVIAAINGNAIGQGLELALACDIRIAVEGSQFGLPQIRTGLIPWDGGTQRLPRLIGRGKASQMIYTGEIIDAQEAYKIGLLNRIVPPHRLMTGAMEMAREMASRGPIALRYAKEAINKGLDLTLEQGLRLEADLYFLLHTTKDRTEGIKAFTEKRIPQFEGK